MFLNQMTAEQKSATEVFYNKFVGCLGFEELAKAEYTKSGLENQTKIEYDVCYIQIGDYIFSDVQEDALMEQLFENSGFNNEDAITSLVNALYSGIKSFKLEMWIENRLILNS